MIKKIAILTIFIGVIALSINILFQENIIVYVTPAEFNGIHFYKFDFWGYIENIRDTIGSPSELSLTAQPLEWRTITANILQSEFWEDLGNNMAFILNYIIFAINIFIYPIRISSYVGKTLLVLIGIKYQEPGSLQWLTDTIDFLTQLQIPYVTND